MPVHLGRLPVCAHLLCAGVMLRVPASVVLPASLMQARRGLQAYAASRRRHKEAIKAANRLLDSYAADSLVDSRASVIQVGICMVAGQPRPMRQAGLHVHIQPRSPAGGGRPARGGHATHPTTRAGCGVQAVAGEASVRGNCAGSLVGCRGRPQGGDAKPGGAKVHHAHKGRGDWSGPAGRRVGLNLRTQLLQALEMQNGFSGGETHNPEFTDPASEEMLGVWLPQLQREEALHTEQSIPEPLMMHYHDE